MHYVDARGILSAKNGMNVYRGCAHGCIYCDSRSKCYGMEHAFEDIEVKRNAPELLEDALRRKRSRCMIGTGSMCDPYQPIEEREMLTRRCLEIIDKHAFGATLITKSDRVLRDLPILKRINEKSKVVVQMTLTTFDEELCSKLEPNVCGTRRRFEVLCRLRDEGIATAVWLTPILPFINDTEENLRGLLDYCFTAEVRGIICPNIGVTLREGNREYFYAKLDELFPGIRRKYERSFGNAYVCPSPNNAALMKILRGECRRHGVLLGMENVFEDISRFEDKLAGEQLRIF